MNKVFFDLEIMYFDFDPITHQKKLTFTKEEIDPDNLFRPRRLKARPKYEKTLTEELAKYLSDIITFLEEEKKKKYENSTLYTKKD